MRFLRHTVVGLLVLVVALVAAVAVFGSAGEQTSAAARRPLAGEPVVTEQWRVSLPVEVVGLPATDNAGVVVTAGESQVVAIAPTGEVEWTTAVDGALANAPRLDHELVFVAAERAVIALNRATGAVVWSVPTTAGSDEPNRANRPVVVGDIVVATAADGLVLGLDRATGAQRWSTDLPTASTAEPAAGGASGVAPVVVVVGIAEWHALEPTTGATLWSAGLGLFGTSSPIVYANGAESLAAVASDEQVVAVDARSGEPRWTAPAEQSELFQVPVLAANGSELLVADHWGRLTSYDPHDGRRLWAVEGPDTAAEFGEPVWLADQRVALPLDAAGPRLASPDGSTRLRVPADGHGVADLPNRGLVVTTWGGTTNYVLLYDVSYP